MTAPLSVTTAPDQLLCRIAGIGDLFAIEGEFVTGKEIPSGHINTTYKATYRKSDGTEDSYILQRINDYVFKDPKAVMRNVEKVTRHINWKVLRRLKDSAGQTLNLYPARGGRNYIDIPGDGIWRCYNYLAGTHTYDVVENTRQAYQAGFAFGSFQDLISDMNPDDIVETIPGFHHTRNRFNRLMEVAELDPQGRLSTCLPELEFIKAREQDVDRLLNLQERGVLPTRITHNDTKINMSCWMRTQTTPSASLTWIRSCPAWCCTTSEIWCAPSLRLRKKTKKTWTRCACACPCSNPL